MSKNDGGQAFPHGDMVHGGCAQCGYPEWEPWHRRKQGANADVTGLAPEGDKS